MDFYIKKKGKEDWRTNTKVNTSYVLYDFARFVGEDKPVQVISPISINNYLNRDKFAYETKKSHRSKVKPFARWLKKNKLIKHDLSLVKIYNNDHEQDETISYLSPKEVETLKAGIKEKVKVDIQKGYQNESRNALWLIDFIDWQRYSGMRISETLSLTPKSINTHTWEVLIGSDSFSTKVKSKQVLPIGNVDILKKIATKLLSSCKANQRLFQHKDRRRTSRTFKKYVREYLPDREDINVHSLRHTCCIELLRKGVPIYTVQRWMRHSSIRTTQKYADLLATDISQAVGEAFN
jgi:site-specific recombinase XerD